MSLPTARPRPMFVPEPYCTDEELPSLINLQYLGHYLSPWMHGRGASAS